MSDTAVYWIYIVYALGCFALFLMGYRRWYGWALLAAVHSIFVVAGVVTNIPWLALGNATYVLIDLTMAWTWWSRAKSDKIASARFLRMMHEQFAEGKKSAIYELMQLEKDIEQLTNSGSSPFSGRRREDQQIAQWLHDRHLEENESNEDTNVDDA